MREFDHDRLEVYQTALRFLVVANEVCQQLPRGRGYLADQLQRASTSVVLNIAEGAGEFAPKEKARFYRMSRRSATESAAVLDVCSNLRLLPQEAYTTGRDLLLQIVSMLVRMITNLGGEEGKGRGRGRGRGEPEHRP
jgi:four helix bundle protein